MSKALNNQIKLSDSVSVKDFGAVGDGLTDDRVAIQAAIDSLATAGGTLLIPPGTFAITNTIDIKDNVNVECQGTILAKAGFSGSYIVTVGAAGRYGEGVINGLRLDGGGQNIKGLYTQNVQTTFFNDTFVRGCLNTGIETGAGYEHIFNRFWVLGAPSGMTANAPGLLAVSGDSHYTDGICTLYPIGVKAAGGNSHFTRIHPWGVYTVGSTPMLHGFWITGEGNTFTDCSPDSPDCANRGSAPSLANGGYGFYVDSTAVVTSFNQCKMIVASNANAPSALLYFGYVSGSFCTFSDCRTDDNNGGAAIAGALQYVSGARSRETTVTGTFAPGGLWLRDQYGTFTPKMYFGGVDISTLGGTYFAGRQTGYWWRVGPMVFFAIHIRLTAKGTATGAVTIGDLPFTYPNLGNGQAWPVDAQFTNSGIAADGRIFVSSGTLISLYTTSTGAALTDTLIGANQELYISGAYPANSAP
jgi:hypothetical protein